MRKKPYPPSDKHPQKAQNCSNIECGKYIPTDSDRYALTAYNGKEGRYSRTRYCSLMCLYISVRKGIQNLIDEEKL